MRLLAPVFFLLLFNPFPPFTNAEFWIPMTKKDTPYCMKPLLKSEDFNPGQNIQVSTKHGRYGDPRRVVNERVPWCTKTGNDFHEWVQVDLGSTKLISGALIEGWKWGNSRSPKVEWTHRVTHYSVEFSPDGRLWTVIKDENGNPRHFHSVREHRSVRKNYYKARAGYQAFDPLLHARFFRLKIQAWRRHQCLSLELYGCESPWAMGNKQLIQQRRSVSITDCHYINPIYLQYWQLTLDSAPYTKYYGANEKGSERKWCVHKTKRYDQFLEFDLLHRRFISRVEVTAFDGKEGKRSQYLDAKRVLFSEDKEIWGGLYLNMRTPVSRILYATKPVPARYVRIPTHKLPYSLNCLRIHLFGCSDEVQSLGLWSDQGRIRMSWATIYKNKEKDRNKLRFIEPGQSLFCTSYVTAKYHTEYFRVDMRDLFAITRLVLIGKTKKDGTSLKCIRDKGSVGLILSSSLDGQLWTPFGTYNQVHGDKLLKSLDVDYEPRYQCAAVIDIMPTIYARQFWIRETFNKRQESCVAMDIFGNEVGKPQPLKGKRKPGCASPLGMESRRIRDNQITASTFSTGQPNMKARNARLNSNGGWCVKKLTNYVYSRNNVKAKRKEHLPNEFLEIDLLSEKFIDGFTTQGHSSRSLDRWVTGYVVHYSIDGYSWDVISTNERERYFVANKNARDKVRQYLNPRIRARYVRFLPMSWINWICMRVEIYGCDAGESLQDKLEKKLLDINKERVEYARIDPAIEKNKYRKDVNIYYKRTIVHCGVPPNDGIPVGNNRYLRELLDFSKTVWVQKSFNNEFNASGGHLLFLYERRILKTRSGKHFVCKGKMYDGTELYRHHIITAKIGLKPPTTFDRGQWLAHSKGFWAAALEVPQFIIQQRVDPAYDGGKPIWETPAVVYASGSVASIGVIILGIPYFEALIPMAYIKDRGWQQSHLGFVRDDKFRIYYCKKLAQRKGFDHFIQRDDKCLSSHAMPANVYKMPDDHKGDTPNKHREYVGPYFIREMRKFQKYQIKWSKFDETKKRWIQIFNYFVTDPDRQTSLLYTMKIENDNDYFTKVRTRARDRYRAYDKASYGDDFTGSHVLDIERVTAADLGTYKIEVYIPARRVRNSAIIELRHEDEPRISLPETFGACARTPLKMSVTLLDEKHQYSSSWSVNWYYITLSKGKMRLRKLKAKNSVTLTVPNPLPEHTGQEYEVEVRNPFGIARGVTRIVVTEDVPSITWVTPSPHLAARDISDVLEVKIKNDKTLITVDWYHNGTLIDRTTEGFTFPGEKYGSSSFRKKLKLARISFDTAGTYRIVARGKYCQFEKKVEVRVIINPRLMVEPHAVYQRLNEGDKEVNMNVTVKGGEPKPQLEDMGWKKSGKPLTPSRYGRVLLHTTLNKQENWVTVLIIRNLKVSDSGDYTFNVKIGPAVTSVTRSLLVLPKQEYRNYNSSATGPPEKESHTAPPPSSKAPRFSFITLLLQILYVLSGLACSLYQ